MTDDPDNEETPRIDRTSPGNTADIVRNSFDTLLEVQYLLQRQQFHEARLLAASIRTRHMRDRALLLCTLGRPVDGQKHT